MDKCPNCDGEHLRRFITSDPIEITPNVFIEMILIQCKDCLNIWTNKDNQHNYAEWTLDI